MKIAFITDDKKTISQHFGRAPFYLIITLEEGKETGRETRDKMSHTHFAKESHGQPAPEAQRGFSAESQSKHARMAAAIQDVDVLVCGGMGGGAYHSMKSNNITPIVTDVVDIEEALGLYLDGKLVDQTEKLH